MLPSGLEGVRGAPGYLGGAESPSWEPGVCGLVEGGLAGSDGWPGVLGSPPTLGKEGQ